MHSIAGPVTLLSAFQADRDTLFKRAVTDRRQSRSLNMRGAQAAMRESMMRPMAAWIVASPVPSRRSWSRAGRRERDNPAEVVSTPRAGRR